jgi:hypothetical protein
MERKGFPDFVRYLSEVLGVMVHVPSLWRHFSTPQMGIARSEGDDFIFGLSNPDCPDTVMRIKQPQNFLS